MWLYDSSFHFHLAADLIVKFEKLNKQGGNQAKQQIRSREVPHTNSSDFMCSWRE